MAETRFSRREVCRLLAGGPAALAFAAPCFGAEKTNQQQPFALRYVLASSMYGKTKLDEILPEVRKAGAERIDLWREHHANQREQVEAMGHDRFAELLKQHGVGLGMTTIWRGDLQSEMRFIKRFGGQLIVTGFVPSKSGLGEFVERLKPAVATAEELGINIGIENHGCNADDLRYFGEAANSPNLGVALAPYWLPQDPQMIARLIEDLGPKLVFFYAWQHGQGCMKKLPKAQELEQMPGRGELDFTPLLAALKKINYQGWTEIFMHPVPRGIPILPTTAEVTEEINHARRYLEECLRKA